MKAGVGEKERFGSNYISDLLQDFCPEGENRKEKSCCVQSTVWGGLEWVLPPLTSHSQGAQAGTSGLRDRHCMLLCHDSGAWWLLLSEGHSTLHSPSSEVRLKFFSSFILFAFFNWV